MGFVTLKIVTLIMLLLAGIPAQDASARGDITPQEPYAIAINALESWIENERADKGIPAMSIALVDDQEVVWAQGFGFEDAAKTRPATSETVYRVGSVSKLFTDLAAMRLVEQGRLDLDAPVSQYIAGFEPENTFDESSVTLRRLMSHRSGLVREPPVGNYLDGTEPPADAIIASLARTTLVYPPETRTKYSNGGIAVVGHVVETLTGQTFPDAARELVLSPMRLDSSSFVLSPELEPRLAEAVMWTLDGREFPAPRFAIATVPAGNLYSTVNDLARFLSVLFAEGRGPQGEVFKKETLHEMITPQCVGEGDRGPFGLGFSLGRLDGRPTIGHGGAVYGFATSLKALPGEKLGVVVVASRDCVNVVTDRIAEFALRSILAVKEGGTLPALEPTDPLEDAEIQELAGRYAAGERVIDLIARGGDLLYQAHGEGPPARLRRLGDELIVDDRLVHGPRLKVLDDGAIECRGLRYEPIPTPRPAPPPSDWEGLIGEYGNDHIVLYILEAYGQLHALIEWFELDPLEQLGPDEFAFPKYNMYDGERLIFTRDATGRATQVVAAGMTLTRRTLRGENGETFQISPLRPIVELRGEALKAIPPQESDTRRKSDLVDLAAMDPTIRLDIRYAQDNNFLGTPVYTAPRAFLQRPAAEALRRAHESLEAEGLGLLIHDAYRPWHITKVFHDATPPESRDFVADPSRGSRHNRGCAVDLTLYDRKTGNAVMMVSGYDEFSPRAAPDYPGGTSLQRWYRDRLRHAMEAQGFTVNEIEWWHFDFKDWAEYPILNQTFDELDRAQDT